MWRKDKDGWRSVAKCRTETWRRVFGTWQIIFHLSTLTKIFVQKCGRLRTQFFSLWEWLFFVDFNNPPPPASSSFISILCLDFFFVWLPDLCVSIHVLESIFLMFAKLKYFILKLASDDLRGQRGHTFWGRLKINWMASNSLRGHGGHCHKEKFQLCRLNVVDL